MKMRFWQFGSQATCLKLRAIQVIMEDETTYTTTIDPTVLYSIARLTTIGTPGVSQLAPITTGFNKSSQENQGVRIKLEDSKLFIDLYLITKAEENVRLVAETVQNRVSRAITEIVGMEVANVNVHITDIDLKAA